MAKIVKKRNPMPRVIGRIVISRNPNDLTLRNSRAVRKRIAQLDAKLVQLRKDVDSLFQRGKKR